MHVEMHFVRHNVDNEVENVEYVENKLLHFHSSGINLANELNWDAADGW